MTTNTNNIKLNQYNISDYPALEPAAQFIGYDLQIPVKKFDDVLNTASDLYQAIAYNFQNSTITIGNTNVQEEYKKHAHVLGTSFTYKRDTTYINSYKDDVNKFMNAMGTKRFFDERNADDETILNGILTLENQYERNIIVFIYSIYYTLGITNDETILKYMAFLQPSATTDATDFAESIYNIEAPVSSAVASASTSATPTLTSASVKHYIIQLT